MQHTESKIQIECVKWFHLQYRTEPALCYHFFSVPNGGLRRLITAQIMKAEGAKPGVSDLLLMVPNGKYNFLAIEMKADKGRQSDNQKIFQKQVEKLGFGKYVICKSFDEFRNEIQNYLAPTQWGKKVS